MRDDFAALDFLSADGVDVPSSQKTARKFAKKMAKKIAKQQKKALLGFPRRANGSKAQRPLTALLPKIAAKVKKPAVYAALQGWPVTLSWPGQAQDDADQLPDLTQPH